MATKAEKQQAYDAGRSLRRVSNDSLPQEAVSDPVAACPFPEGDEQRAEWLQGFKDAIDEENTVQADHSKVISDALKVASKARA